mmetsp:Transcript_19894/g.48841  ORF Transcript_19894/g.48841 Transcript_19894/m.48841 type:complete len:205 (-) Transcript_19894:665-1279(-)
MAKLPAGPLRFSKNGSWFISSALIMKMMEFSVMAMSCGAKAQFGISKVEVASGSKFSSAHSVNVTSKLLLIGSCDQDQPTKLPSGHRCGCAVWASPPIKSGSNSSKSLPSLTGRAAFKTPPIVSSPSVSKVIGSKRNGNPASKRVNTFPPNEMIWVFAEFLMSVLKAPPTILDRTEGSAGSVLRPFFSRESSPSKLGPVPKVPR